MLENANLADEREEVQKKQIEKKLCLNLSLCELKLSNHPRACMYARKVLDIDNKEVSAWCIIPSSYSTIC